MGQLLMQLGFNTGDNHLMGVGGSKQDTNFTEPEVWLHLLRRLLAQVRMMTLQKFFGCPVLKGDNRFNVSVNGINGVVEVPSGFYVGSTLAEALEKRINQIMDPITGETVGGVTVDIQVRQIILSLLQVQLEMIQR